MKFINSHLQLPDTFYSESRPLKFDRPTLLAFNESLAGDLQFDCSKYNSQELADIFSAQKQLQGSQFVSLAYAGHQFGHLVPSLGDGRALLLGEVESCDGKSFDIQLKGAGPTQYSRRGDGRSALGPVLREYILSEAMFHLGVPTTRALAAVATNDFVMREEGPLAGGIFTRVAASHIRIGTFVYFSHRNETENLKLLLDYSVKRHYPEHQDQDQETKTKALKFLGSVTQAQAKLVAKWMSLGFIHGVMNTDNMSISGETIDYGPCAFMDYFNFNQVYSYIDRNGRYSYINQANILMWNLTRLAEALFPLINDVEKTNEELARTPSLFKKYFNDFMMAKLGLENNNESESEKLISLWLGYLDQEKIDFTLAHRKLTNTSDSFFKETVEFKEFITLRNSKLSLNNSLQSKMNSLNPIYIPRNHQVEKAIERGYKGDFTSFHIMNELVKNPFKEDARFSGFELPPGPEEVVKNTFCGT